MQILNDIEDKLNERLDMYERRLSTETNGDSILELTSRITEIETVLGWIGTDKKLIKHNGGLRYED